MRAILFDFNGVLLDDESAHFELFRRVLGEEGIELDEATYYRELVHYDDISGFRHALSSAGRSDCSAKEKLDELCARKAAYYRELSLQSPFPFFSGAIELVRSAAEAGLPVGVVSGALRPEIESALRREGLDTAVRLIVAAEDVAASKPDPSGYRLGHSGLNAASPQPSPPLMASEVLAIEDTVEGLQAAAAAGLQTLGVAHTLRAEQLSMADWTIGSLSEIGLGDLTRHFGDSRKGARR